MGTKLLVGKTSIELPRGAVIPREGDVLRITLKTEKKEKIYAIDLIETTYNFNTAFPIGNTEITLKEIKEKKSHNIPAYASEV